MHSPPSYTRILVMLIAFCVCQPCYSAGAIEKKDVIGVVNKTTGSRLMIWCPWANEPIRRKFLNGAAIAFQKRTGARLEIFMMNKNGLQEKLAADWERKKSRPDIAYIDSDFKQRQIGDALLDLQNLSLPSGRDPHWELGDAGGGSKNYLPIEGHGTAIYYNKILFFKAGIKLPKERLLNADEFFEIVRRLRSRGITPIAEGVVGGEDKAAVPVFITMIRYAGYEKIRKLTRREINFSDPDIIRALMYWKKIVDAGGYDCSRLQKLEPAGAILDMMDDRAAISFSDTLSYAKISAKKRIRGLVGVLDWPNVPEGKGNNTFVNTYGSGYGINRHSRRIGLAQQFLQFLLTPSVARLWTRYVQSPYPVPVHTWPSGSIYDELAVQRLNQIQREGLGRLYFQKSALNNLWREMSRSFICGQISVNDFVQRMNRHF